MKNTKHEMNKTCQHNDNRNSKKSKYGLTKK